MHPQLLAISAPPCVHNHTGQLHCTTHHNRSRALPPSQAFRLGGAAYSTFKDEGFKMLKAGRSDGPLPQLSQVARALNDTVNAANSKDAAGAFKVLEEGGKLFFQNVRQAARPSQRTRPCPAASCFIR